VTEWARMTVARSGDLVTIKITRNENAGREIAGHGNAGHENR